MTLKIVQFDPFALTPYYNFALCQALTGAGCEVRYVTSRYSYDAIPAPLNFLIDEHYFPRQSGQYFQVGRKAYKLFSYGFGHQAFLKSLEITRTDVVHFQWSRVPLFDLPLVRKIKALGIRSELLTEKLSTIRIVNSEKPLQWKSNIETIAIPNAISFNKFSAKRASSMKMPTNSHYSWWHESIRVKTTKHCLKR